ncbi:NUMOD1 domain-containing DNA-binding protein [Solibacillus silvestris]
MYCVYKHTTPNGKIYIGITGKKASQRWANGISGYANNKHFLNAIKKYGWNNIKHEILFEGLTKEEACRKETELILKFKSNNPEYGYNLSSGGECHTLGCKWTEEHKKKTSNALKGHFVSEETKEKIRTARLKQTNVKSPPILKGAKNNKAKQIIAKDKNGNIIETFETVSQAAKYFNVCHQSISDCCRGKLKAVKGIVFMYESVVI